METDLGLFPEADFNLPISHFVQFFVGEAAAEIPFGLGKASDARWPYFSVLMSSYGGVGAYTQTLDIITICKDISALSLSVACWNEQMSSPDDVFLSKFWAV